MKNLSLLLFQDTELLPLLLCAALILLVIKFYYDRHRKPAKNEKDEENDRALPLPFVRASHRVRYTRKDRVILVTACTLYALFSFWELGSAKFPHTTWQPQADQPNQSFILKLSEDTSFDQINVIYGEGDNNANLSSLQLGVEGMTIEGSNDLNSWAMITTLEKGSIYEYLTIEGSWNYRYIRITAASKNQTLTEIAFKKAGEDSLLPVTVQEDDNFSSKYPASLVIDEQDLVSIHPTYMQQAYFDEIYHPRNAWEIANGEYMYATVHPLFGTNLIALSIKLFGMNPLAWRLPGAIFGVLIIPMFYAILKMLFGDIRLCTFGTILCAADFMHLTTSRIATLEPFSVFFILLMFYWMIRWCQTSWYDTKFSSSLKLLLWGGIFMGVAIATKWTACYSAVGLAIILFASFFRRYREYKKAKQFLNERQGTDEQNQFAKKVVSTFPKAMRTTFLCCFPFYIFIPVIIYWLVYLPDHVWRDGWSIANVWKQNMYMYNYHTNLKATHPYQSTWYMWLVDARPIWYFSGVKAEGISHSISCFSNPLLTWAGLPAIIYTAVDFIRHRDRHAGIILAGYLTALGPWVLLVKRCVFAYHFYPTSFFTMLAIVYAAQALLKKDEKYLKWIYVFEGVYVFLFLMFLPATAGFGTTQTYVKLLEWFPTWYFG